MRYGIRRLAACVGAVAFCASLHAADAVGLYDYPRLHLRHSLLRVQLMNAMRSGNITNMEAVCRQGLELMPGDATWQFNLACALAYRATPDAALDALEKAVRAGFRNASAIEQDGDLQRISSSPRFKAIVREARDTADLPAPGRAIPRTARLTQGTRLVLSKSNLAWDFDRGLYVANFKFLRGAVESPEARAAIYDGPAKEALAAWLADGTAAGNGGDLYVNRDRNHSRIKTRAFPLLSELCFDAEAKSKGVDNAMPNTLYPGAAVVGNASLAIVSSNDTCSLVRMAMQDLVSMSALRQCYLDNQLWVFPAHKDYVPEKGIDRYQGATPCALQSVGSSGSDRYFVRAALAASAALRPETKRAVVERKLFAPLMQYLFRRTRTGVESEEDYLTGKAHPTAFDRGSLDALRMVELAHGLTPKTIPPVILPLSAFVPVSSLDLEKELDLRFVPYGEYGGKLSYAWRVVHGDRERVAIVPGEDGAVHLTVDCRSLTSRIDVACFAKTADSGWGAPSFVSIYPQKAAVGD